MEFPNRNTQQAAAPGQHAQHVPAPASGRKHSSDNGKWSRVGVALAALVIAVLLAAVIAVLISSNNDKGQSKYVESGKLQAVFLNTGQVYFGNIKSMNSNYFVMTNIYYLQTANSNSSSSTANSNTNVSLVKLGCELHEPYDQMVINSDQVTFWENLNDSGQVAKAVANFEKANPDGQKCSVTASNASTNDSSNVQNAGNGSNSTNKQ
jgi:hypothetical protein